MEEREYRLTEKGWVFISMDNGAAEAGPGLGGTGRDLAHAEPWLYTMQSTE